MADNASPWQMVVWKRHRPLDKIPLRFRSRRPYFRWSSLFMRKVWFERELPREHAVLLAGRAEPIGAADPAGGDPMAMLPAAEAIVAAARVRYDASLFAKTPLLRAVCRTGIGYDNINVADATKFGIAVCNVPDGPTVSTAEHAVCLMLAVAKNLHRTSRVLRDGVRGDYFTMFTGVELDGLTLGLVGLGRIGSRVARAARGLGMHVLACDPYLNRELAREVGAEAVDSLDALFARADVVSLHLPLTPETRYLVNAERLARMKPGTILINTARGGLVDEGALLAALESGHLRGAGLDVFDSEPPPADHPLLLRPDVIATPHVAAATVAAKARLWHGAIRQALAVLEGQRPVHLVNPEVWPVKP
jgi:D-3-phosphoglycerate dehydrogenase